MQDFIFQVFSEQERTFLADRLLGSLSGNKATDIDDAWIEEAERRYEKYRLGNRPGIDAKRVFEKADQLFK